MRRCYMQLSSDTFGKKMVKCSKSMLNPHRRQQKSKEKQNRGYDKEEKRVPKLIIRLGVKPTVIGSSDEKNSNNLKSNDKAENAGSFISSIADKVKLRKRGQSSTSDAHLFKTISESSLPEKKRKKKNSSTFVSSESVLPSTIPPPSVEADKTMFKLEFNKTLTPSLTFKPRASEIIDHSHDYAQSPSLNSGSRLSFNDTFIGNPSVTSYNLPSKKAKLSEHLPFIEKNSSATSSIVDILQLDVASYEEVSSVEHVHTSSVPIPPEYFGISDDDAPSTNMLQRINSTSLPKNEEKSVLNTAKVYHTHSEDCWKNQKKADGVSLHDHDYLMTINESFLEEIGVSNKELKNLDLSVVEEFFSHAKELSLVKKRTDDYVDKMMDLAIQIEKEQKCPGISGEVNGLVNKDSSIVALPTLKHSIQTRDGHNINGLKSRINSRDDAKILTKLSRSSTSHDLSFKIHARDDKSTHDNFGVFRQENHATKDKKKAMDGRCIVYVGNIPHDYSVSQLRERFKKFGAIKDIQIKSKKCDFNSSDAHSLGSEEMRNYGFITFSCNQEASDAIERGNKGHKLQFHLSFGARRQFVGEEYKDLDGIVAKNENSIYKHNSRSAFLSQNKEEDDFDIILKNAMKARGVKPQPFRMKCKV